MATSKPETKPPARKATRAAAAKSSPSTTKAPTAAPVTAPSPTKNTAALAKPAPAATKSVPLPAAKAAPARKPTAVAKKTAAPAKKKAPARKPSTAPAAPASKPALLSGDNPQITKADGDAPVQAYIAATPDDWRRGLCARLDALVEANVPEVTKAVRWNSPFYGLAGQGWFLGYHVFAKFIKVSFFKGASLDPAPAGGSGEDARWINIQEGGLDEAQMVSWIKQAAALPGWGKN